MGLDEARIHLSAHIRDLGRGNGSCFGIHHNILRPSASSFGYRQHGAVQFRRSKFPRKRIYLIQACPLLTVQVSLRRHQGRYRAPRPARAGRLRTIYDPVDNPRVRGLSLVSAEHSWLAEGEPPTIAVMGHLELQKDFSCLLRAFSTVSEEISARRGISALAHDGLDLRARALGAGPDAGFLAQPISFAKTMHTLRPFLMMGRPLDRINRSPRLRYLAGLTGIEPVHPPRAVRTLFGSNSRGLISCLATVSSKCRGVPSFGRVGSCVFGARVRGDGRFSPFGIDFL
jgi:hypothetical protein